MPYKAFKVGEQWCVYKLGVGDGRIGETLGCHPSKTEAQAQVDALYANEPEAAEQEPGGPEMCVCPDCDYETEKERGTPCRSMKCPECGAMLVAGTEEEQAPEMEELTKTVDGKQRPASDFLVVEDPEKVDTWHLPVKVNGKPDHNLMGGAKAALTSPGGHRGQRYQGPDKAKAIAALKALYKAEKLEWSSEMDAIIDGLLKLAEAAGYLAQQITEAFELNDEPKEPMAETVQLGESSDGAVIALRESEDVVDGPAPLQLDVVVIEPGWGNKRDNHFYSAEMLKAHANAFKGAKMYATDHRADEKSVRTEVSQVLECPVGFTETGAPIARVGVFDNQFADNVRNRAALGKLEDLAVSILANGTARPIERDGRKGKQIESISSEGVNVDWVTRAGAGGRALRLAEMEDPMADEIQVGKEDQVKVEDEVTEVPEQPEAETPEDAVDPEPVEQEDPEPVEEVQVSEEDAPAPELLAESEVKAALENSTLPDASRERLTEMSYADAKALQEAINAEIAYVAKLTGSGRPVGQERVPTAAADKRPLSEVYDEIDKRHGIYRGND